MSDTTTDIAGLREHLAALGFELICAKAGSLKQVKRNVFEQKQGRYAANEINQSGIVNTISASNPEDLLMRVESTRADRARLKEWAPTGAVPIKRGRR